ncbi:MAG: PhzF family phenazine biosynthesis protein [Caulobacterales bacterium]|jgi:trans-2,3-dihydro-3-hydroxyanthranilate isomerase
MKTLSFTTMDVFTIEPFAGNPLAVVEGAEGLTTDQMQAIAREFNLSETIFLMPPQDPLHTARVRIFTPNIEMPFAGHPTVGAAIFLAQQRFPPDAPIDAILVLEENVGPVRCAVALQPNGPSYAEFDSPRLSQKAGTSGTVASVAEAICLSPADIGFDGHTPVVYSAGAPFAFAPLSSLSSLAAARPGPYLNQVIGERIGLLAYARLPDDSPNAFRVRMFAPDKGVPEDPATGSAAAAFAGVLARFEKLADGRHLFPIEQGVEMGRPSLIALEIETLGGVLTACRVGGHAVRVASGQIRVPIA